MVRGQGQVIRGMERGKSVIDVREKTKRARARARAKARARIRHVIYVVVCVGLVIVEQQAAQRAATVIVTSLRGQQG